MSTVEEIKVAIQTLSLEERAELARWLHGWSDDDWDRQMWMEVGRKDRRMPD